MNNASRRRYPVGYDPRKERRQISAKMNQDARALRSSEEQLKILDTRPGLSKKERRRLRKAMG